MYIPDMVIVVNAKLFTVWILVLWYTNYVIDPLVYVFFKIYRNRRSHKQPPGPTEVPK